MCLRSRLWRLQAQVRLQWLQAQVRLQWLLVLVRLQWLLVLVRPCLRRHQTLLIYLVESILLICPAQNLSPRLYQRIQECCLAAR